MEKDDAGNPRRMLFTADTFLRRKVGLSRKAIERDFGEQIV